MAWVGRDLKDHLFPAPLQWAGFSCENRKCFFLVDVALDKCLFFSVLDKEKENAQALLTTQPFLDKKTVVTWNICI